MSRKALERKPRADAADRRDRIVEAALDVFGGVPNASMDDVAHAVRLSRQTVYAHFPSRDVLLLAAIERASERAMVAIDESRLDEGSAMEALLRLIDVSWDMFERYPLLLTAAQQMRGTGDFEAGAADHDPVRARMHALIRRGRRAGEMARTPSADWLVAATIALGHQAGAEVAAGRMSARSARRAVAESLRRLYAPAGHAMDGSGA